MPNPVPIKEQLAQAVAGALAKVAPVNGYQETFTVIRPKTELESIDPADQTCVLWQANPDPEPAPYGQVGWNQAFAIVIYVREPEDGVPIEQRINLAEAEATKALLVDPRFGGLCYIDSKFLKPIIDADPKSGFSTIWLFLECHYRTLRDDPFTLAPSATNEYFWQGGAVLYLQRYLTSPISSYPGTLGAQVRMADVKATPKVEPKFETVYDDRESLSRPIERKITCWDTYYEIEGQDFSPKVQALMMGDSTVSQYIPPTSPATVGLKVVQADSTVSITDAQGNQVWNLAAVQSVTNLSASTTYTPGADYIVNSYNLLEGSIDIPPSSTIPPGGILVTYSLKPVSGNRQAMMNSQEAEDVRFFGRICWIDDSGEMVASDGPFDCAITPESQTREIEKVSENKFRLTPLSNQSNTPMGRIIFPIGALPAVGS